MSDFSAVIINPRHAVNRGGVERACWNFGATSITRCGLGSGKPCTDTPKAHRHLPVIDLPGDPVVAAEWSYATGTTLVAVETPDRFTGPRPAHSIGTWFGGFPLPERVLYVLGNETTGLSRHWLSICHQWVYLPMARAGSANVAATAAIVLQRHYEATAPSRLAADIATRREAVR